MRNRGQRLPVLCDGYEAKDIFNADETGMFFRAMPTKSIVTKGDSCIGGNNAKDRITVLLAASATGEKLRPLVIGKSKKPRCFYGFEVALLGTDYDFHYMAESSTVVDAIIWLKSAWDILQASPIVKCLGK